MITHENITNVPESEIRFRRQRLYGFMEREKLDAFIFYGSVAMRYFSNCICMPTERPIALVLRADGHTAMMVPLMEYDYAVQTVMGVDEFVCYDEYPGDPNPMYLLRDLLKKMKLENAVIGSDSSGYPAVTGSRCPGLDAIMEGVTLKLYPLVIEDFQLYKSEYDLKAIRESARWAGLALGLLQDYTRPGVVEMDAQNRAVEEASRIMLRTLGPDFVPYTTGFTGVANAYAGYRGQIGKRSALPHTTTTNAPFRLGDAVIGEACGYLLEYGSELERTMFVGEPGKTHIEYYQHAVNLQNIALEMMRPGIECAEIDKAVKQYYRENGLMPYWRHHTGHGLGFSAGHERPFLDENDHTVIEKGMCFSIEPGLYVPEVGGFRLSDTVAVHEDGCELITYYPRDIDRLICG